MNEFFKKLLDQVKTLWGKTTTVQKIIIFGILAVTLVVIFLVVQFSASPTRVNLISSPITDELVRNQIVSRLDAMGIDSVVRDGYIMVKDKKTALAANAILIREDLLPKVDPWALIDVERWTITDFERNVNLRRAITKNLEQLIEALDDVDNANVIITMPEDSFFSENQKPVTAVVQITPAPGSDITTNRKSLQGIEKMVMLAIEGLKSENITINDTHGIQLNDFTGLAALDQLDITKREIQITRMLEAQYKESILSALSGIFGASRVRMINTDITPDFSKKTIQSKEYSPIVMRADNPKTPYDETEVVPSITMAKETASEKFTGTGMNPEGPPGQEGQTPAAYKDLSSMVGDYSKDSTKQNEAVNEKQVSTETSGWEIKRVSVAVAIDGVWKWTYKPDGSPKFNPDGTIVRTYEPVSDEDLAKAKSLVEHAVGYLKERGDAVSVQHIPFDHTEEQRIEDQKYRNDANMRNTLLYSLIGITVVLFAFVIFRILSREVERRRRLREEELSRQHQALREQALRSAEETGVEVEMSVEERERMEMQENAVNMAREHPEDVAQLIRTWLMEE